MLSYMPVLSLMYHCPSSKREKKSFLSNNYFKFEVMGHIISDENIVKAVWFSLPRRSRRIVVCTSQSLNNLPIVLCLEEFMAF